MGKRRPARPSSSTPRTLHGAVVVAEVDLHGFTVERAEARVESFLRTWSVREPGAVVRIITGRGARSDGRAALQDAIRTALSGWARDWVVDWSVDRGAGAYLVRLRR
ncbi:MAG: Smr/MutS family protein [Gemmatimonadota bacterium]|jgi:DNA-nicking Smr family endonuclease